MPPLKKEVFLFTNRKLLVNVITYCTLCNKYHNMKQNTTESFRIEKDILENVKLITSKTGQTTKGYISIVLQKQIEKDMKKHFKITEIEC